MSLDPTFSYAAQYAAGALAFNLGRSEEALALLRSALKNDPENKDPRYTKLTIEADGFFIVTPEYNHSFPGTLKRMLDSELQNYIHKPVAFAGVSNGIFGGARAIEELVPTIREMGMVATFSDVYFPQIQNLFDENGNILDEGYERRIKRGYEELIWMAKTLKWGRENIKSIYH